MRAVSLAAIATALIATAPLSAARADQIITESFTLTIPSSVVPGGTQPFAQFFSTPFPLFPATTGKLESVNVTLSGSISIVSLIASPDIGIVLQGPSPDGIDSGTFEPGTTDLNLSGPDKAPNYIGTGTAQAFLLVLSNSSLLNTSLIQSNGPLDGVVSYTYTLPTLAVPEAPTWATMLIGFAALGVASCRAARKAAVRV
jgi:hypothetical protein